MVPFFAATDSAGPARSLHARSAGRQTPLYARKKRHVENVVAINFEQMDGAAEGRRKLVGKAASLARLGPAFSETSCLPGPPQQASRSRWRNYPGRGDGLASAWDFKPSPEPWGPGFACAA